LPSLALAGRFSQLKILFPPADAFRCAGGHIVLHKPIAGHALYGFSFCSKAFSAQNITSIYIVWFAELNAQRGSFIHDIMKTEMRGCSRWLKNADARIAARQWCSNLSA